MAFVPWATRQMKAVMRVSHPKECASGLSLICDHFWSSSGAITMVSPWWRSWAMLTPVMIMTSLTRDTTTIQTTGTPAPKTPTSNYPLRSQWHRKPKHTSPPSARKSSWSERTTGLLATWRWTPLSRLRVVKVSNFFISYDFDEKLTPCFL